jgi:hypothetical protein
MAVTDCYSNYLRDIVNDFVFGSGSPATLYFAAMSVMPTASGGGTEAAGFSRLAVTNNSTNFPASSGQVKTNATALNFGNNSGSAVTIVGIGIYDANSSGNLRVFFELTTSVTVNNGQPFTMPIGGCTFNWAA